jgi:hypothetical protein
MMRALAGLCVLLVVFSMAVPGAAATPAILAPGVNAFDAPSAVTSVGFSADAAPPDRIAAACVPARAPPLA